MKSDFLRAHYLAFDWSGWIALIKSKILITKGMSLPSSFDKWKAPIAKTIMHLVAKQWILQHMWSCECKLFTKEKASYT